MLYDHPALYGEKDPMANIARRRKKPCITVHPGTNMTEEQEGNEIVLRRQG